MAVIGWIELLMPQIINCMQTFNLRFVGGYIIIVIFLLRVTIFCDAIKNSVNCNLCHILLLETTLFLRLLLSIFMLMEQHICCVLT